MRTAHRFWITTTVFFNPENPPHFSIKNFKKKFYSVFWLRKATLIFADFLVRKCAWEKLKFKNSTLCHFGRTVHSGGLKNGVRLSSGGPIIWSIQLVKNSGGRFHHLTFLDPFFLFFSRSDRLVFVKHHVQGGTKSSIDFPRCT